METLTLLYVMVTTLIFLGTAVALVYSARNLKEAVAARSEQARAVFETTFFHMVSLHHAIVRDIWVIQKDFRRKRPEDRRPLEGEFDITEQRVEGRAAFLAMYGRIKGAYEEQTRGHDETDELKRIKAAYETFFQQHGNRVGHYFRNLYNTVKYVDRTAPRDKQLYLNILRAQLSSTELLLLFYNCLTDHGSPKFKTLVERDRKSTRLNSSHSQISYAVFCLK